MAKAMNPVAHSATYATSIRGLGSNAPDNTNSPTIGSRPNAPIAARARAERGVVGTKAPTAHCPSNPPAQTKPARMKPAAARLGPAVRNSVPSRTSPAMVTADQ